MSVSIFLIYKAIVVDKVPVAGVVGWVDIDALHLPGMGHAEVAQSIEVVAFDDEILVGGVATGQAWIKIQSHEIAIQALVVLDLIAFPHQPEFRLAVALA